jgi:HAD superfamily hydrolase (TIGR01509 family)
MALLTNSGPSTRATLVARHRLERWFPVILISAEEGMSKPDPLIYRRTCERLGRRPDECLFVDDRAANVAGAEAAGLGAIRFAMSGETIPIVLDRLGLDHLKVR